jgi:hypothetical protein
LDGDGLLFLLPKRDCEQTDPSQVRLSVKPVSSPPPAHGDPEIFRRRRNLEVRVKENRELLRRSVHGDWRFCFFKIDWTSELRGAQSAALQDPVGRCGSQNGQLIQPDEQSRVVLRCIHTYKQIPQKGLL